jgi:hypothetical protein
MELDFAAAGVESPLAARARRSEPTATCLKRRGCPRVSVGVRESPKVRKPPAKKSAGGFFVGDYEGLGGSGSTFLLFVV